MCDYRRGLAAPSVTPKVGFLFIGGYHHMLHLAPVAASLARRGDLEVHLFAGSDADGAQLDRLLGRFGMRLPIEILPTPSWARMLPRLKRGWAALKLPRIFAARRQLTAMDVLVTAERTSTMIKRLPGRSPVLVHIPHGAGDRAQGFEPRLRLFDHIIVAGPKDRDRMIAAGVVKAEACTVSGYVKLAAVMAEQRRHGSNRKLFANGRRTIVYNPHFAPGLSSWDSHGEAFVRAVASKTDFNLIVAPHVRLKERLSADQRREIEKLAVPGRVIIDLGSERSCDMTYTLAADIYVGDVSSQVYEFLHRPRPCLFIDVVGKAWEADPNFGFWHLGDVASEGADLIDAVEQATDRHITYRTKQQDAVDKAFGPYGDAVETAAAIVADLTRERSRAMLVA